MGSPREQAQQRAPRRVVRLHCVWDFGPKGSGNGFTHNLSTTGLSIELSTEGLPAPPAEGDELSVSFVLPGESTELRAQCIVAWTVPASDAASVVRLGARFRDPSHAFVTALATFVASFRFSVLVVEPDVRLRHSIRDALAADFRLLTASSMSEALQVLRSEFVAAVIFGGRALEPVPLDALAAFARAGLARNAPCVVVAPHHDALLVRSGGVFEVVVESAEASVLRQVMQHAVERYQLAVENERLHHELERVIIKLRGENTELRQQVATPDVHGLIGNSETLRRAIVMVEAVRGSSVPVYLHGESGTGKEVLARAIHFGGPRASHPFVAHNCAVTSPTLLQSILFGHKRGAFTGAERDHPGLFEQADGGSLFLDEVADLPPEVQSALLRVAQDGEVVPVGGTTPRRVDVRLISASNRSLHDAVQAGRFRADLFYRLVVVQIDLPTLRERRDDIPLLVDHFLRRAGDRHGIAAGDVSPAAMRALESYPWPGNVRELANEIERAVVLGRGATIDLPHLSPRLQGAAGRAAKAGLYDLLPGTSLDATLEAIERQLIVEALGRCDHNQSAAARELGIQRATLRYRMAKHHIEAIEDDRNLSHKDD